MAGFLRLIGSEADLPPISLNGSGIFQIKSSAAIGAAAEIFFSGVSQKMLAY